MNKFIIFALLFVFVLNKDYDDFYYVGDGEDYYNCKKLTENDASVDKCSAVKINNGDYNCCYEIMELGGEKDISCEVVKKSDVKDFVNDFNDEADDRGSVSIDCSSNYISNALLILLSLLF